MLQETMRFSIVSRPKTARWGSELGNPDAAAAQSGWPSPLAGILPEGRSLDFQCARKARFLRESRGERAKFIAVENK